MREIDEEIGAHVHADPADDSDLAARRDTWLMTPVNRQCLNERSVAQPIGGTRQKQSTAP